MQPRPKWRISGFGLLQIRTKKKQTKTNQNHHHDNNNNVYILYAVPKRLFYSYFQSLCS